MQTLDDTKCEHILILSLFLSIAIQPVVVDSTSLHLRIFSVPVVPHTVIMTERARGDVTARMATTEPSPTPLLSPAPVSELFVNLFFLFVLSLLYVFMIANWHISFPLTSRS